MSARACRSAACIQLTLPALALLAAASLARA